MSQLSSAGKITVPSKEEILLAKEARYCSWGDTVHYAKELKIFSGCEGIYVYDRQGTPYLDLQMWHSVANFGYKNERLNNIVKDQIDALPQFSCQYLHEEKILLAEKIAQNIEKTFGVQGRVHFNIGGAAAIEDAIKIVRNHTKKNSMFAFMGGIMAVHWVPRRSLPATVTANILDTLQTGPILSLIRIVSVVLVIAGKTVAI